MVMVRYRRGLCSPNLSPFEYKPIKSFSFLFFNIYLSFGILRYAVICNALVIALI